MTQTMTHTPGPWQALCKGNWNTVVMADKGQIADCRGSAIRLEECEANARLIAAAPELLEALKELTGLFPKRGAWEAAQAAIAKAEGR